MHQSYVGTQDKMAILESEANLNERTSNPMFKHDEDDDEGQFDRDPSSDIYSKRLVISKHSQVFEDIDLK